jgi:membrane-bound metal-dependent hydrolase YbcI (DUF457 family)
MKGIAHFSVGVAVASCFHTAIHAAEHGNPFYFIAGGIFGLLPDTIDFKLYRFFYKHDAEVVADPLSPDPQIMASALANAILYSQKHNRPFKIRMNTIRLGADTWQSYVIRFNLRENRVEVELGKVIDTGGTAVGTPAGGVLTASAAIPSGVHLEYLAEIKVGAFEGPIFRTVPEKGVRMMIEFIPWHRSQSHSICYAMIFALLTGVFFNMAAAAITMLAYSSHVALDNLGYMGSNILWPFTSGRHPGMKLLHSGDGFANFYTIWLALIVIFVNLSIAAEPVHRSMHLPAIMAWGIVIPLLLRVFLNRLPK